MVSALVSGSTATYIVLLLLGAAFYFVDRARNIHLPPGPKRRWIIGNLLDVPSKIDRHVLAQWKDRFGKVSLRSLQSNLTDTFPTIIGELLFLKAFGYSVLVLNSPDAVYDLLDKRGHIYSHRPRFVMAGELMGLNRVCIQIHSTHKHPHGPRRNSA